MWFKNIYFLLFVVLITSCEINEQRKVAVMDKDNLLLGNWVSPVYNEETTTFIRGASLPEESYGILFQHNGTLIERTSGFCGTPPLTFFNVEGTFVLENDIISITKESYPSFYGWKIIELTEKKLVVKREVSEQEKDHKILMDLFDEISNLAYNETCLDANNWQFVAYGAKACGGWQGYIPYHKNIDVSTFLDKIEAYTKAEKEFNVKWSVASDCAIVNPPKSVDCQNGYPVLIY
jgi:hypothetical protein